ncbi:hypothetical protein TA3x_005563 [Tundrisphaera sp. TA3]|uniref:hypothetical protein n=1 Tax=Tundrisphaera sp. TA3 TaxID=3435775 RepID=UPI003EB7863F
MRRPTSALTAALAAIGLSTPLAGAQQPAPPRAAAPAADEANPTMLGRPARYLLRNGMDYLAYREYGRALSFLRAVEARQAELNDAERKTLKQAIARAQEGLREPVNAPRVASNKGRAKVQSGAFALAQAPPAEEPAPAAEPVVLTAATLEMAAAAPVPKPIPAESSAPVFGAEAASLPSLPPSTPAAMGDGAPMVALPAEAPAAAEPPAALAEVATPEVPAPAELPPASPASPEPTAPSELPPAMPELPAPAAAPAELPVASPSGFEAAPIPAANPEPAAPAEAPALVDPAAAPTLALPPDEPQGLPMPEPSPTPVALAPGDAMPQPAAFPEAPVEPAPPPEADALPPLPSDTATEPRQSTRAPSVSPYSPILTPKLQEEVERIAQRQPDEDRQLINRPQTTDTVDPNDPMAPMAPIQGSTRLELPRAPSPTEARPLRRIPVPEEFETLAARDWGANRKYWAAAATCHMPLYFQDAVLERYGQSAEQALGPNGRFFSYPLDDPKQSNQRNQILQPFASIGLYCFQIGTLPIKMIVDPPWEAEYDLGYYRPGDRIPPDTIYATPAGLGPPGHGRKY